MITLSTHFFMEVLIKRMHATVDKFATLNREGNAILYTLKHSPKVKRTVTLAEGKRIFEDLYGDIAERWVTTPEYKALAARKAKAASRKPARKGRA